MKNAVWALTVLVALPFELPAQDAAAAEASIIGSVRVTVPKQLGTLEFERQDGYDDPSLGVSVAYQGRGQVLTIYFYNYGLSGIPDGIDNDVVQEHYEQVKGDVLNSKSYEQVVFHREGRIRFGSDPAAVPALEAEFRIVRKQGQLMSSYLMLTGARGLFVKVRFSIAEGSELEATANRNAVLEGLAVILPTIEQIEP